VSMMSVAIKPGMLSVVMLIVVMLSDVASSKIRHYRSFIFKMLIQFCNLRVADFRLTFKLCRTMLDIPGSNPIYPFSPSLISRTNDPQCLTLVRPLQPSLLFVDKATRQARPGSLKMLYSEGRL
jgi:hypothetical protein